MRILRIFNEVMREGTLPGEEPGLFLVSRETGRKLYRLSAIDDEEDQETPFQEMDAQQLTAKTAEILHSLRPAIAAKARPGSRARHAAAVRFLLTSTRNAPRSGSVKREYR
jgi:hypothetical protein